ncbi:MAG: hypothetical protein QOI27_552, partial [Gaiellaceae bacterium]|nr:hypothetical protein [Gaiellaceae bacterium]
MTRANPLVREALLSAAAAALVASLLAWLGPPGTDLAAHAYQRTLFLQHGFTLWNNFWYAGRYSFVTYSLLYYPLAAWLGIRLLAVATIALAALAFAVVLGREWGPTARWSSRSFAVVWAGIVLSAAFPFALGMALALLAIWALQSGARWRAVVLAALALAASPLAFLLLVVVLAGIALARRDALRRNWMLVAGVAVSGLGEVVLWRLFPGGGRFPFSFVEVCAGVAFCLVGLVFTWRVESARVLRFFFAVYLAAYIGSYLIPSAIGENVGRLRFAAIPVAVLVFSLRKWRPLIPGIVVLMLAVSWNVTPLAASYFKNGSDFTSQASTWPAAIAYLHKHLGASYRVEAVDTSTHWPAVYLADAGIPIARGWFRQDDFPQNQVLYGKLGAKAYLGWLHGLGVKYVVLSGAPPDYSARGEARLLRSGHSGLTPVMQTASLTILKVPHARAIITGPGYPKLASLTGSRMQAVVHRGGTYRIAVRYSPYWRASNGCLSQGKDGMLRLATRRAETVGLVFEIDASRALGQLAGESPQCSLP